MMGIEEGTWDDQWVLHVGGEPWESAPKTKSTLYTLYVSQFGNKSYLKKRKKIWVTGQRTQHKRKSKRIPRMMTK